MYDSVVLSQLIIVRRARITCGRAAAVAVRWPLEPASARDSRLELESLQMLDPFTDLRDLSRAAVRLVERSQCEVCESARGVVILLDGARQLLHLQGGEVRVEKIEADEGASRRRESATERRREVTQNVRPTAQLMEEEDRRRSDGQKNGRNETR